MASYGWREGGAVMSPESCVLSPEWAGVTQHSALSTQDYEFRGARD